MKDMELVDGRSGGEGGAAAGRCEQGNKSQTASSNLAELRSGTRAVNDHENVTGAFDANKFNSHEFVYSPCTCKALQIVCRHNTVFL